MNWYFKQIIAQIVQTRGLLSFLEDIGVSEEIINYIVSITDKTLIPLIVNEVKKNPNLTLEQVQSIRMPQRNIPYDQNDILFSQYLPPGMQKWYLVNARIAKMRGKNLNINPSIYDLFKGKIQEIKDWYKAKLPDINSYSMDMAINASDQWHKETALQGEGLEYDQTNRKLVIYGPRWKNKAWNGWTIQKIVSENDLKVEGNRMKHCVGDYCEQVKEGDSVIYSLRDPGNNPHVTMETDSQNNIIQIHGNSNTEPKDEYKSMIKEWVLSTKNPGIHQYIDDYDDPIGNLGPRYNNVEDILDILQTINEDSYGIETKTSYELLEIVKLAVEMELNRRDPEYRGDITRIADAVLGYALEKYKKDPKDILQQITDLEQYAYKLYEEVWEYAIDWDIGSYPNEEDYATDEEYQKAIEEHQKAEDEYREEEIRRTPQGGVANALLTRINNLRLKKIIPSERYTKKLVPASTLKIENWYKQAQQQWSWEKFLATFGITMVIGLASLWGIGTFDVKKHFEQNPQQVIELAEKISKNDVKNTSLISPPQSKITKIPKNNIQKQINNTEDVSSMIIRHEGRRKQMYLDSMKIPSIGIGFNLTREDADEKLRIVGSSLSYVMNKGNLTDKQINKLFEIDLLTAIKNAKHFLPNFEEQPRTIQNVVIDMTFNLGLPKLEEFKDFRKALIEYNYTQATQELIGSKWYGQVTGRAKELINMIEKQK